MEQPKAVGMETRNLVRLDFNLNLQMHLSSLQKCLKSKKIGDSRRQILSWMHLVMTNLALTSRTIELCLILADRLLFVDCCNPQNTELFCIACIIFTIKYEGDFSVELHEFLQSIYGTFSNAGAELLELEKAILLLIPADFASMSTLSDYIYSLMSPLQGDTLPRHAIQTLADSAVKRMIFSETWLEIDHLIAFPTLTAVLDNGDDRHLQRRMACALKKLKATHPLSLRRYQHFAGRFLNKPII
jgi:hypothetical protein